MDRAQAIKAADALQARYFPRSTPRQEDGRSGEHLAYMVQQMHRGESPNDRIIGGMSDGKIMRWIGFIQGALVLRGDASLEDMKEVSRKAVYE